MKTELLMATIMLCQLTFPQSGKRLKADDKAPAFITTDVSSGSIKLLAF